MRTPNFRRVNFRRVDNVPQEAIRAFADAQWARFNDEQGVTAEAFQSEKKYLRAGSPEEPRGYLSYVLGRGVAYIESCIVDPRFRKMDYAINLVAAAEIDAKRQGCHAVWAKTRADNVPMRNLLKKLGYRKVKIPVPFELGVDWIMHFKEL